MATMHRKCLLCVRFSAMQPKVYCYRLGTSTQAECTFAKAKYGGTRGNKLTIKITADVDNANYFIVSTLLDGVAVDEQRVKTAAELVANDFVTFKTTGVTLSATSGHASYGRCGLCKHYGYTLPGVFGCCRKLLV